jgi:hypothetical protein
MYTVYSVRLAKTRQHSGFCLHQTIRLAMDQSNRKHHRPKIGSHKFERMQWDWAAERRTITDYLATALRTAIYDGQIRGRGAQPG